MRSSNATLTDRIMIGIPDVTPRTETEDADALGRGIVDDPETETTIVDRVAIEEIGEIIHLVGEILTEPTDPEETITGTTTSATIDVETILIPIRTTMPTLATIRLNIRKTTTHRM